MKLQKPKSISENDFKSKKWDEIVTGRKFSTSDIPTLTLLVQWYAVIEKCESDMAVDGDIQVAYQNQLGDIKALPQIATMKQASAEVRALNKQLGINDAVKNTSDKHVASFQTIKGKIKKDAKDRKSAS